MALTTFHSTGIQYAADFFAEDTIALMLQPPQALTLEEMVMGVAPPPDTPEAAVAAAWAELADDADFQKAVSEKVKSTSPKPRRRRRSSAASRRRWAPRSMQSWPIRSR